MFNFKRLFAAAAIAASLTGTAALAQSDQPGQAQVYFENDLSTDGAYSVYVDGNKAFDGVFTSSFTQFPVAIPAGQHTVVVTRSYNAPGVNDLISKAVNVSDGGTYTLTVADNTTADVATGIVSGYDLSLSSGAPENN